MFTRLLDRVRTIRTPAIAPAIPDGERVYAVGDIHGRLDLLDQLIAMIEADDAARAPATTTLIFLGDLVDRGPDSAGVVERLLSISRQASGVRFLQGNHEEMFLATLRGDLRVLRAFCRIGGDATMLSYGVSQAECDEASDEALLATLRQLVPAGHIDFLEGFEDMIVIGDYAFVHAGVRPGKSLDDQRPGDLRWIRSEFLDHRSDFGKVIVHGHTITDKVDERPNRIGLDTGAYASSRLTAMGFEGQSRWVLDTAGAANG